MNECIVLFFKGLVFGITMAAVPGPIFFLIVQRTIADGALIGILCALGAITADAIYALMAAVGLTFIMGFFIAHQTVLSLIGGVFLIGLGIKTYLRKPVMQEATPVRDTHFAGAWLSIFLLTLTNPVTVISYCIIFAGLGLGSDHTTAGSTVILVGGVMTGAALVVFVLIGFLHFFRNKFSPRLIHILNKVTAILLIGFGIIAIARIFFTRTSVPEISHSITEAQESFCPK